MLSFCTLVWSLIACTVTQNLKLPDTSSIGQGFYLPEKNLFTNFLDGANIFKDLPSSCLHKHPKGTSQRNVHYYRTTEEVFQMITSNTGLAGSLSGENTIEATLNVITSYLTVSEKNVTGMSLDMQDVHTTVDLTQDCLTDTNNLLSESLLRDFRSLPKLINEPRLRPSWRHYDTFLKKYGSHVVTQLQYGSRINHFTFAKSSLEYKQRDFEVRGCLDFAGPTEYGNINVSACSSVTTDEINEVRSYEMTKKLVVLGGTAQTRERLPPVTPDNIKQFLEAADPSDQAIGHSFVPIWRILKFRGLDETIIANMKSYYLGYLDFGCQYQHKYNENDQILQEFVQEEFQDFPNEGVPRYICRIPPVGCQNDSACHLLSSYAWLECGCYGPGCVWWTPVNKINDDKTYYEASMDRKYSYYGIYKHDQASITCIYHNAWKCKCEQKEGWRVQWDSFEH